MSEQQVVFGCKYIINDIDASLRCYNQDSPYFSEVVNTKCHKCCEYEEYEPKTNMPFQEALKLMVWPEGSDFEWIFSLEKHKYTVRPYLSIQFVDNKQMRRYMDAWARCYEELQKLEQKSVSSAQPDIKQAAKLLSDFIESCPGGDSYLITPDGEKLRTDWGYAMEGIKLIHDWAERRTDD